MLRVAAYDPGRKRDGFGMVIAEVDQKHIYLRDCLVWYAKDVTRVADEIAQISKKARIERHICESNSLGTSCIDMLKRYHSIHCHPITTVRAVKDKSKLQRADTMGKLNAIEFFEYARQKGIFLMPAKPWTKGIKLFQRQLDNYERKLTSDSVRYGAADEDINDDLISAALVLTFWSRMKILRIGYPNNTVLAARRSTAYDRIQDALRSNTDKDAERLRNVMEKKVRARLPHMADIAVAIDGKPI